MEHATVTRPDSRSTFAVLLDAHRRLIFKVAHTYAHLADVEDLAQEIAAQAWRSYPSFDPTRRFSTWLYRIALNVAISWLRNETARRRRSIPYDAQLHEPAAEFDAEGPEEGARILHGFIAQQDPLNRALLLLYLEERSYEEMSEILGVSVTNLTTQIGRLKERLRIYAMARHSLDAEQHHGTR
jgi:RNA polymerase sigma factor (sigma-70 family)